MLFLLLFGVKDKRHIIAYIRVLSSAHWTFTVGRSVSGKARFIYTAHFIYKAIQCALQKKKTKPSNLFGLLDMDLLDLLSHGGPILATF